MRLLLLKLLSFPLSQSICLHPVLVFVFCGPFLLQCQDSGLRHCSSANYRAKELPKSSAVSPIPFISLLSTKITQEHAFQLIHVEREHIQTMSGSDEHHQDITKRQSSSQKADNVDPTVPGDASKPATPQIEGILQGLGHPSLLAPQSPLFHRSGLDPHRR